MPHTFRSSLALSLAAGLALASTALGEPPKNERPRRGPNHSSDVLSGPKVGERPIDLEGSSEMRRERPAAGELMKARLFQRALDSLRTEQAGDDRLSDAQDAQIKEIRSAFEGQLRAYREEHREEARALMAQLPAAQRERVQRALAGPEGPRGEEGRRPRDGRDGEPGRRARGPQGARPDADEMMSPEPPSPEQVEKAQGRLREIAEGAPKPDETHAKILAVLSESQRQRVGAEVERLRDEAAQRRDKEMGEQRAKRAVREGAQGAAGEKGDRGWLRDVPREELRKLRDLPAEERKAAMEELRAKYAKPQPK